MTVFSNEDRRKIFFYADKDAKYYDVVEELTQPHIDLIHDTMIDLAEYSFLWKQPNNEKETYYILDIGSGTGAEAFRAIERFANVHIVAIDFSTAMNRIFRQKFIERHAGATFSSKVTLIEEDFFSDVCRPANLLNNLSIKETFQGFNAVIAGFFLHHYPAHKKIEFYHRAFEFLKTGGVLIHGDLFGYQSKSLSNYSHDFGERWISRQLLTPDEHLIEKKKAIGKAAGRLRKEWLRHWNDTHIYHPAERPYDTAMFSDNLEIMGYEGFVKKAGFLEFGFPFRLWEAGILWAKK